MQVEQIETSPEGNIFRFTLHPPEGYFLQYTGFGCSDKKMDIRYRLRTDNKEAYLPAELDNSFVLPLNYHVLKVEQDGSNVTVFTQWIDPVEFPKHPSIEFVFSPVS